MATSIQSDAKVQTDAVLKALPLGLVLAPTRLTLLLQAMLGLLRLLLRALLAIIPPGAGLIKMQVIGGSKRLKRFVRNWALCPSPARMLHLGSQRLFCLDHRGAGLSFA
jgi:hypothetical protein